MTTKKKNLSNYDKASIPDAHKMKFGIVRALWNTEITSALHSACVDTLVKHGAAKEDIETIEVPGSFELPFGGKLMLKKNRFDAIILIGCVIEGETTHNVYINHTVAQTISALSLSSGIPFIFGVLTPNTMEQALDRAGGKHGNKGTEAAIAAIQMVALKKQSESANHKIGFQA